MFMFQTQTSNIFLFKSEFFKS